jgi:hypothetical protein
VARAVDGEAERSPPLPCARPGLYLQQRTDSGRRRSCSTHAADLLSDSAGLVHDNERRWRVFRTRLDAILADPPG